MRLPALSAGLLMAAYLLVRPYPDDYSSPWWIVSHACGMASFVALAVLADRVGGRARPVVALGVALLLPYYGAETFGLAARGPGGPGAAAVLPAPGGSDGLRGGLPGRRCLVRDPYVGTVPVRGHGS